MYNRQIKKIRDATIQGGTFFGRTNPWYAKERPDTWDFSVLQNACSFDGGERPKRNGAGRGGAASANQ